MPAGPVLSIYLIWGGLCAGLRLAGAVVPLEFPGLDYLFIGICLYGAALVTDIYLVRLEPRFAARPALRRAGLAATVLMVLGSYLLVALTGYRSNLLSGTLTITLILFACILGGWLASHLKRPPEIVAVGVTAALADMFSVFKGPTKALSREIAGFYEGGMQGLPPMVDFFLVKVPLPGQTQFMPLFGITDWVVIAFLAAAAFRFNMDDNLVGVPRRGMRPKFFLVPAAGAGLVLAIVFARAANLFVPALPFAVAVYLGFMLVKYPGMRRLTKAEILPLAGISFLLIALMILV